MRIAFATILLAACLPALAADGMKPGLWEIRHQGGGAGGSDRMGQAMARMNEQMASMSPEQRKQVEAMMASRGMQMGPGAGGGMAIKVCITPEMAARQEVPTGRGECKTTSKDRTADGVKLAFSCANPPSEGESQVSFTGTDAFSSRTTVRTTVQGKPETMTMQSTGKWLGADCGSVKPLQAR